MVPPIVICCVSLIVMSLGFILGWTYFECSPHVILSCYILYTVLACSSLLIGPLIMILINIALSPKHQTGSGTVKIVAEIDAFRNMLMVR